MTPMIVMGSSFGHAAVIGSRRRFGALPCNQRWVFTCKAKQSKAKQLSTKLRRAVSEDSPCLPTVYQRLHSLSSATLACRRDSIIITIFVPVQGQSHMQHEHVGDSVAQRMLRSM